MNLGFFELCRKSEHTLRAKQSKPFGSLSQVLSCKVYAKGIHYLQHHVIPRFCAGRQFHEQMRQLILITILNAGF